MNCECGLVIGLLMVVLSLVVIIVLLITTVNNILDGFLICAVGITALLGGLLIGAAIENW